MKIKSDLSRYGYSGTKGFIKAFFIPGFRYTLLIRLIQNGNILNPIYKFFWRFYSRWYGIQIQYNTMIGEGFYIGHFGNIIINGDTKIGKNCNIAQGVTIGKTNRGVMKGAPKIGNEVWIGANAVIVGNIIIGNNVLIAPNSFVNFNVPDNSIVFGNPAIVKSSLKATENYINNKI